ncbi:UNVERIFIED_CONTAM: hypothetical protein FKN15_053611 [Acipenser sinensis]
MLLGPASVRRCLPLFTFLGKLLESVPGSAERLTLEHSIESLVRSVREAVRLGNPEVQKQGLLLFREVLQRISHLPVPVQYQALQSLVEAALERCRDTAETASLTQRRATAQTASEPSRAGAFILSSLETFHRACSVVDTLESFARFLLSACDTLCIPTITSLCERAPSASLILVFYSVLNSQYSLVPSMMGQFSAKLASSLRLLQTLLDQDLSSSLLTVSLSERRERPLEAPDSALYPLSSERANWLLTALQSLLTQRQELLLHSAVGCLGALLDFLTRRNQDTALHAVSQPWTRFLVYTLLNSGEELVLHPALLSLITLRPPMDVLPLSALLLSLALTASCERRDSSLEIYKRLFETKRRDQLTALKNLVELNDVNQQYKIIDIMLKGLFKVLEDSRAVLIAANVQPDDAFPQEEKLKEAYSHVVENTAFFGDVALRFPRIVHHYYDRNSNWNLLLRWGLGFCNLTGLFQEGQGGHGGISCVQVLHTADEFQKVLREEEKRRRKEERRKEIRKGPRISRSEL